MGIGVVMATVKIKGLDGVRAMVRRIFEETRSDTGLLKEIGEITSDQVRGFTRSGTSVATGKSFPPLKPSTIKNREYLAKYNSTHSAYSPSKSNLTLTGELLDSVQTSKVFKGSVTVEPKGTHKPYKTKTGKGKSVENAKIFEYLEDKGFEVFSFGQEFRRRLQARVNVLIKSTLRRKILK